VHLWTPHPIEFTFATVRLRAGAGRDLDPKRRRVINQDTPIHEA